MLTTAISSSASGIQAGSTFLDVVSNNIANSNTPGFKAGQVSFQDQLYVSLNPPGASTDGATRPVGTQVGTGTLVDAISGLFTQGNVQLTNGRFDLAIQGEGFFPVFLAGGGLGYTRAGNFTTDNLGQLVTPDGFLLAGVGGTTITVPAGTASISLSPDGTVTAVNSSGGTQVIGQVVLTRFVNPNGLLRVGNNVFVQTLASGVATTGAPGTNGLGGVTNGSLEQSNVDLTTELINLVIAQQTFSFNAQALQVESQVLQATTDLIR